MMLRLAFALILFALPVRADVEIQDVTSPGGIHAWLVESHELPFTALEIRFRGGTSLDAEGARGAVNLMTGLLEEGAGDLDAQEFAKARDALAASFSFRPSTDAIAISARFLTENRGEAVDLLRLALVDPRFDPEAVERVRGQVLSGLASDAKDPGHIAGQTFDSQAFGGHPYGSDGSGTPESVRGLARDQIVAAHDGALARDRVYVAAAGDITAEDLGALLDRLLGDLPAEGAPMPQRADWMLDGGVTVVEFPTPQASVRFGQQGIKRDDPDFFPAYVLNEVLGGGGFGSRLMTEVREKRGLTYGIGTYLAPMDHAEMMMGYFASSNATVGQAIEIVRGEWRQAATEGVTAEELEATKTYLTGSYPLRFDGNGPIASILVGMQMEGLPIDYPVTRNARIEAVTLEDVKRVAERLLRPEALHFVVVGQPEGVSSDG
ncbi:M16 family metallopeptidase [Rhodobacter sp. NSM]|uniref:M16 family metallopeptidase n=1 Tax=Rhodobacter sp. NSM TaxID=3457501 RepID=UPI003FD0DD68